MSTDPTIRYATHRPPACIWVASDQQRAVRGRHSPECLARATETGAGATQGVEAGTNATDVVSGPQDGCEGCEACTEPHCYVCTRAHHNDTCPDCLDETRENLHAIATVCGALPTEAKHRGVNGEAMALLAPAADPEAWNHREASALAGRVPADYLADTRDEQHPTFVLGTWEMLWREHLDQPTSLTATLPRLVAYLDLQLHVMAAEPLIPFRDFAIGLRTCLAHLRAVIHDQNQGDVANVGCFECGSQLERRLTDTGFEDVWTCKGCRRQYTHAEYNFALRASLEQAQEASA